jgi:hypothetical protein
MPDIRKTLGDPKPFYFVAGAGEVAVEKLRDAPAKLAEAQERLATDAPSWISEAQQRLVDAQSKVRLDLTSLRGSISGTDLRGLRERAQVIALSQVGRALEAAGKAVEAYDELAERGKTVVGRLLGEQQSEPDAEPKTVIRVEQVSVDDEAQADEAQADEEPAAETPAKETPAGGAAKKTTAKKTTAKKTTAPRRTPPKKDTAS